MWKVKGFINHCHENLVFVHPLACLIYLNAWFAQVDAEPVRISGVVINKLLQCAERLPSGDPEPTLVKRSDPVVLDGVTVPHRQ